MKFMYHTQKIFQISSNEYETDKIHYLIGLL